MFKVNSLRGQLSVENFYASVFISSTNEITVHLTFGNRVTANGEFPSGEVDRQRENMDPRSSWSNVTTTTIWLQPLKGNRFDRMCLRQSLADLSRQQAHCPFFDHHIQWYPRYLLSTSQNQLTVIKCRVLFCYGKNLIGKLAKEDWGNMNSCRKSLQELQMNNSSHTFWA